MKVGVIGCGLIGSKRADSIRSSYIKACFDNNTRSAKIFSKKYDCNLCTNEKDFFNVELDLVIISVTHDQLTKYAIKALKKNCHILIEKPGGISSNDLLIIKKLSKIKKLSVKIGFNHRYLDCFRKLKEIYAKLKKKDELMFIKASYGHGGRKNYEKEWRFNIKKSGGGELIDQGSHLIDICIWLLKEIHVDYSTLHDYFWKKGIEDNVFLILKTNSNQVIQLHTSWTEWKNSFRFELYMKKSKILIDGIGKSYGEQRLVFYNMNKSMKPPVIKEYKFKSNDNSWRKETMEFINSIKQKRFLNESLDDCIKLNKLILSAYKKNAGKKILYNYK